MTRGSRTPLLRYVAFLRAINVGGHTVKMDRLRAEFDALGFRDVETFIASGNVLFAAASGDPSTLEHRIEERLEKTLGYPVATFLRTPEELAAVVGYEPFPERDETTGLWVGFLKSELSREARDKLVAFRTEVDELESRGREAFWMCRTRFSESKVSGAKMEKALAMPATFRNVTTVRKLALKTLTESRRAAAR
jgi:uncharacterized protein (DUF1697 family)